MAALRYPLIDPNPPRLSEHLDVLKRIEASGIYSNNGPELRAFEAEATEQLFDGQGACLLQQYTEARLAPVQFHARYRLPRRTCP